MTAWGCEGLRSREPPRRSKGGSVGEPHSRRHTARTRATRPPISAEPPLTDSISDEPQPSDTGSRSLQDVALVRCQSPIGPDVIGSDNEIKSAAGREAADEQAIPSQSDGESGTHCASVRAIIPE